MGRITKEYIQDYVTEVTGLETEHRKGSSFYASASHTFTSKDIAELAESEIDASELLGITVTLNGYWSDYDGCEWDDEIVFLQKLRNMKYLFLKWLSLPTTKLKSEKLK